MEGSGAPAGEGLHGGAQQRLCEERGAARVRHVLKAEREEPRMFAAADVDLRVAQLAEAAAAPVAEEVERLAAVGVRAAQRHPAGNAAPSSAVNSLPAYRPRGS